MTITTYTDREIALKAERDTLRKQLAEAQALIEASRKQEPVAWQYQSRDGTWCDFLNDKHYDDTKADGTWPIRCLYTAPVVADDLLKDAQRYRWLRESDSDEACVMAYIEGLDEWVAYASAESVDMAIDAAITGAKK